MGDLKGAVAALLLLPGLCGCAHLTATPLSDHALPASPLPAEFVSADAARSLTNGGVRPPPGFADFCRRSSEQCAAPGNAPRTVMLTADTLQTIRLVNIAMNRAILPEEDIDHYGRAEFWTIPIDGYGDCDDYVLVKRKALLNLGFPELALRIAEVFTQRFVRHEVLVVSTDKANYVLDNLTDDVTTWDETDYAWLKWQDPDSPSGWTSSHENRISRY